jgi:hypothetical protein
VTSSGANSSTALSVVLHGQVQRGDGGGVWATPPTAAAARRRRSVSRARPPRVRRPDAAASFRIKGREMWQQAETGGLMKDVHLQVLTEAEAATY